MSSTVNELTVRVINGNGYDALSTSVGIVTILVLLVVLVTQQISLAVAGERSSRRALALNTTIAPLVLSFATVVVLRLLDLIRG